MRSLKALVAAGVVAGGLVTGMGIANAGPGDPPWPPGYPEGDPPAADAPAKPPTPRWSPNTPVVWQNLGHRWGIWINDSFLPLH